MAYPYIFEAKVDANLATPFGWDSESDTGSLLDAPHFSELARFPWSHCAPYRGAYCWRVRMGDTNDHVLIEGDCDIADGATAFASFYLYVAPDVVASADDEFNIFEFQQAGGTVEASVGLRITAATDVVEIGIGDGTAATDYAAATLEKNRWYHIEVGMLVSTGAVGTLTLYVDGVSVVALDTLDNAAAVGRGVLGTQDTLATTTGTLLFDQFVFDDLQVYPDRERFPHQRVFTVSGHAFVGPGAIDTAALLSTTAADRVRLYDTDTGNVNDAQGFVAELLTEGHTSIEGVLQFKRGCYVSLNQSTARAQVTLSSGDAIPGSLGPRYYSPSGIRRWGLVRKERPGNV